MKLTESLRLSIRSAALKKADAKLLATFRQQHENEIAHLSDEEVLDRIEQSRAMATCFGIKSKHLRMRFIMIGTLRLPMFWQDPGLVAFMESPSGNPDICFEDLCGALKIAAIRSGTPDRVWW